MKLDLMEHHIRIIGELYGKNMEEMGSYQNDFFDSYYGRGAFRGLLDWTNSLDLNSGVMILPNRNLPGKGVNIDSLCKLVDCRYQESCSTSGMKTKWKMFLRNPVGFPDLYLASLDNRRFKVSDKGLEVGQEYPLKQILETYGR